MCRAIGYRPTADVRAPRRRPAPPSPGWRDGADRSTGWVSSSSAATWRGSRPRRPGRTPSSRGFRCRRRRAGPARRWPACAAIISAPDRTVAERISTETIGGPRRQSPEISQRQSERGRLDVVRVDAAAAADVDADDRAQLDRAHDVGGEVLHHRAVHQHVRCRSSPAAGCRAGRCWPAAPRAPGRCGAAGRRRSSGWPRRRRTAATDRRSCRSPKCSASRSRTLSPWVMAIIGKAMSSSGLESTNALRMRVSISSSSQPMARPAAMIAPIETPPTKSIGTPRSCSARIAPTWA